MTRALLAGGAVAGPAFVATALVEGARRPGYDPRRHPISSLALGPGGRVQVANFLATGAGFIAGAVGLVRAHGDHPAGGGAGGRAQAVLVGLVGVGLLGAGAFATDPVSGYPQGTPDVPSPATVTGHLHDGFSALVFLGIPAAALSSARSAWRSGGRAWSASSLASAVLFGTSFVRAIRGFAQDPRLVAGAGIDQRLTVALGFGWISALELRARSRC